MFTEADLKLNKFKLDEEASKQSSLYHFYSEQLADAKAKKDTVQNMLDEALAKVELEIRKNPPEGLKITEGVVKSLVNSHSEVIKVKNELQKTKADVYRLESIVYALDHKKSMLKILTELYVVGYYRFDDFGKTTNVQKEIRSKLNEKRKIKKEEEL